MAEFKNKKITSRDEDFAKWYTDIVKNANLVSYTSVKGCLVIEPYAYAIWENIQKNLDAMFKQTGHTNVYMPLFIPESLLKKESEHVEGFAPEVAWVTHGGKNELEEKLCVRPTSETLFCEYYANKVTSYRDLPKLYNQWCNVVRWEKETRPFLRTREFLWQEGHTVHATAQEAEEETMRMLNIYKTFFEEYLAIPVVVGKKTEKEKFAGAEYTLTVEALMYNGVSLQSATSHYFGQKFSKPFGVSFMNKNNEQEYVYQTSWGTTTRMIGALIMVHGDDNGLVIPPKIAPTQVVIVPIKQTEEVSNTCAELQQQLQQLGVRVMVDTSEKSAGFKFAEHEMHGIPVRVEVGPRDLEKGEVTLARRDTYQKQQVSVHEAGQTIVQLLQNIQQNMFARVKKHNEERTYTCTNLDDVRTILKTKLGFMKAMWCGDKACEEKMKEIGGVKSRCIPFEQEKLADTCIVCGKPAKYMVYWGVQY